MKRVRRINIILAVAAAVLTVGDLARAVTFDVAADFSAANNPNGAWSYGWSSTLTSAINAYPSHGKIDSTGKLDYWYDPSIISAYTPNIVHNGTANAVNVSTVTFQPGQLSLSPGYAGQYSHVRWTAPYAGSFSIAATFTGIDWDWGTTTDVHVMRNGTSLFDGAVNGYGNKSSFARTVILSQGEVIDFAVGYGSDRDYRYDTTALAATITVPEPGTLALLGFGVMVVRRRRAAKRI
jgi:hypothetical protein